MRSTWLLLVVLAAFPAFAGDRASFIAGTYVMEGRCDKWRALEAGGPRNLETVPEMLTATGFASWEGGCSFESITEEKPGERWSARMACAEEAEEWSENDVFELDPRTGRLSVSVDGKTSVFVRCDEAKGN